MHATGKNMNGNSRQPKLHSRPHGSDDRRLNKALAEENWQEARKILLAELKNDPDNHWLLARLSSVYYEEKNYGDALKYIVRAKKLMPACPLVQWDLAGTLLATGQVQNALEIYEGLLRKGPTRLINNPCSEGKEWAVSLLVDCFFCIGLCYQELENIDKSRIAFNSFLQLRSAARDGVYSVEDAANRLRSLPRQSPSILAREIREAMDSLSVFAG
jgi:tetratricopeptide (TPR) repeat protein